MKRIILSFCYLLPLFLIAQPDSLLSGLYNWKSPAAAVNAMNSTVLFAGKVHDMEWLQMSANSLKTSQAKTTVSVPSNEEHLIIVKSGVLKFILGDSTYALAEGSVALLMPAERYSMQNTQIEQAQFYLMKYRSRKPANMQRAAASGGSAVLDWKKVAFRSHDKGGKRNFFDRPTAMCARFEMHVTTLNVGLKSHDPHTHAPEEIILVTAGETKMQIADKFFPGTPGSIYYAGTNVPHAIENTGKAPCTYFAFQFE